MKVLLVWEEIPNSTKLFMLDGELAEIALAAHGQYVNLVGDNSGAEALSEALEGVAELPQDNPVDINEPVTVVVSGFML